MVGWLLIRRNFLPRQIDFIVYFFVKKYLNSKPEWPRLPPDKYNHPKCNHSKEFICLNHLSSHFNLNKLEQGLCECSQYNSLFFLRKLIVIPRYPENDRTKIYAFEVKLVLSICLNLQQPMNHYGLCLKIMTMSESNCQRGRFVSFSFFLRLISICKICTYKQ